MIWLAMICAAFMVAVYLLTVRLAGELPDDQG